MIKVLVVDDSALMRKHLVTLLESEGGFQVRVARNGMEALALLGSFDPDVITLDINMPEMDGITATQRIRRLPLKNVPKIIAVTANALAGDREKCLQVGMDDYISKPVQKRDLVAIVMKYSAPLQKRA
jgi:two-component system chemotaxis response regulator CheB